VTPGIRPAVTQLYSARNSGSVRAEKPPPPTPPLPPTLPPGATSPGDPTARWPDPSQCQQARPWMGATARPDWEDGAPHQVAWIIDLTTMSCRQAMQQTAAAQHDQNSEGGGGGGAAPLLLRWVWGGGQQLPGGGEV
jgi:hypothetical protein